MGSRTIVVVRLTNPKGAEFEVELPQIFLELGLCIYKDKDKNHRILTRSYIFYSEKKKARGHATAGVIEEIGNEMAEIEALLEEVAELIDAKQHPKNPNYYR
ncbi:hypothetical protein POM88_020149 [Heracleum sosnowskyi]|uniref:Uncharacterized protein n=1 Tax=Heracleum sosnowskyi TaxID=360622 RepID=A0AAD8MRP7_9APIA|nr:hypothetical protein POM88_020149 [Heracleum sosnowskyi]